MKKLLALYISLQIYVALSLPTSTDPLDTTTAFPDTTTASPVDTSTIKETTTTEATT